MTIDFCTMCVSESELKLIKMNINSLRFYSGNHITNYKISIPPDRVDVIDICKKLDVQVLIHPVYIQKMMFNCHLSQVGFDCANRMNELVKSCESDWVLLSHLDVVWKRSITIDLQDHSGMVGWWPHGSVLINRRVYDMCHYGFWPLANLWAIPFGDDSVKLVGSYERSGKTFIVDGLDVSWILKLEMQNYGYGFSDELLKTYHHIGGGSCINSQDSYNRIQWAIREFKQFNE
jgi:hypothetical protein